jgi:hypothetical protein
MLVKVDHANFTVESLRDTAEQKWSEGGMYEAEDKAAWHAVCANLAREDVGWWNRTEYVPAEIISKDKEEV